MRELLENLQKRKDLREDICQDCDGKGSLDRVVCTSCLGQGILLYRKEYEFLLSYANRIDDEILSQQEFN